MLHLAASASSQQSVNQIYVSFGKTPSASSYDFAYLSPVSADQTVIVPTTQAGTYYITVVAASVGTADTYTLTATEPQFSVVDTAYGVGGNGGNLTLQINGTKFDRNLVATLKGPSNSSLSAISYYYVSPTRFYATFNLLGAAAGTYDMAVGDGSGLTQTVAGGLRVINAPAPSQIFPIVHGPASVGDRSNFDFRILWGNGSLNDAPAPIIDVLASGGPFDEAPAAVYGHTSTEFYGSPSDDGPPGIIRPGFTYSRTFYSMIPRSVHFDLITAGEPYASLSDAFDWPSLYPQLIPVGMSDAQFRPVFDRMIADDGSTWGGYLSMLSRNAPLIPAALGNPSDIQPMLDLEVRRVQAELGTSISGRVFAPAIAVVTAGKTVLARNTTTGDIFSTTSLNDGSFILESVTPGNYTFNVPGLSIISGATTSVAGSQALTGVEINVASGARFRGVITGQNTNSGIDGAIVTATGSDGVSYTTVADADGSYVLSGLAPDTYTLGAAGNGYAAETLGTFTLSANVTQTENSILQIGGGFDGTVKLAAGDSDNSSLSVTIVSNGSTSAASRLVPIDGLRFALSNLPAGTYTVSITADNYAPMTLPSVVIANGATTHLGNVQLLKSLSIDGKVISSDGSAVAGTVVELYQGAQLIALAPTDNLDHYHFGNLAPGTYTLTTVPVKGLPTSITIGFPSGDFIFVNLTDNPGGAISGIVTNAITLQPAASVVKLVYDDGTQLYAVTDGEGNYQFKGLVAGVYSVMPAADAQAAATVNITAIDGTAVHRNLTISPVATLSGRVLNGGGGGLSGAKVTLLSSGQPVSSAQADANGFYTFDLFATGTYGLAVTEPHTVIPNVDSIPINNGDHLVLNVSAGVNELTLALPINVSLVNALATLLVNSADVPVAVRQNIPDKAGNVMFTGVPDGNYLIQVSGIGGVFVSQSVTVSGNTTVNAVLQPTVDLTGLITDAGNVPLANATISLISADGTILLGGTSGTDGTYSIVGALPGTYLLDVMADGHVTHTQTLMVPATGAVANAALATSTTHIVGRVLDHGVAVGGAAVYIVNSQQQLLGQAVTGANGTFSVDTAVGSNLTVIVAASG